MLRITQVGGNGSGTEIYLEGQLTGPWVATLQQMCEQALADGSALTLDFSQVSFLDAKGVSLVRELAARRISIRNCSPFVTAQIQGTAP